MTEDTVYDVLCCADLYLLPGLKRHCANCIAKHLNTSNVVQVTRTARLFSLPRLEDQCAEFIANNIEEVMLVFTSNLNKHQKNNAKSMLGLIANTQKK